MARMRGMTLALQAGRQEEDLPEDGWRDVALVGLVLILAFFGGLGSWAAFAPLSSAAIAHGFVRVEDNRQAVQHRDGGIVREILAHEGATVKEGDVLLRLETTELSAQAAILGGQVDALRAQRARLVAERDGLDAIPFEPEQVARRSTDAELDGILSSQERVFEARRSSLRNQEEVMGQRSRQLREQIGGFRQQLDSTREQLRLISSELDGKRQLFEKGLIPRPQVLALERTAASLQGTVGQLSSSVAEAEARINEVETQVLQLRRDRNSEVATQLRDAEQRLYDLGPQLEAVKAQVGRAELRAPMSGTVTGLTAYTKGGVVRAGEKVMEIIPSDRPLIVDARLDPKYGDSVQPRMQAEVRLSLFGVRRKPIIFGEVQTVSADRFTDERTGEPYYRLLVAISPETLASAGITELVPGVPADVMVPLTERTFLDYLLTPLTEAVRYGLREP